MLGEPGRDRNGKECGICLPRRWKHRTARQIKIAQAVNTAITIDHAQILAFIHPGRTDLVIAVPRLLKDMVQPFLWPLPILEISLAAFPQRLVQQLVSLTTDRASSSQNLKSTDML